MDFNQLIERPEVIWFVLGILMLVLELGLPGLIIFFFGLGAIITGLTCLIFDIPTWLQIFIFIATSVTSLLVLRKKFSAIFQGKKMLRNLTDADLDDYMGKKCKVVKEIKPNQNGKIEFHGTNWNAHCEEEVKNGAIVEIIGRENITLIVKKI